MPAILEIKDLSLFLHGNKEQVLVEQVSFQLNKGKVLGLVGESGSGKSLTALSILSLLPDNIRIGSGDIFFYDPNEKINLLSLSEENIRHYRGKKIAMIFQEPMTSLNPSMRCGKQIEEGIKAHYNLRQKEIREKVLALLKEVHLPRVTDLYNNYPHQLSGGQRQRLMIAMALSADPELIIADEPTTALDVTVQKNIIDLLKSLRKSRDLSVLFISHDLRLIKDIADDVLVMRKGKIIEKAPVNEIFHYSRAPYTKGLIACQPPLSSRPARLSTIQDFENMKNDPDMINFPGKPDIDYHDQPLLRIENLSVSYSIPGRISLTGRKTFRAVSRVNFDVFRGETLGLVGESGCGKTTIGKTILKLINHDEGQIWYNGVKIDTFNRKERRLFRKNVQVVFQDPFSSLNPRQNIFEMLNESVKFHFPDLNRKQRVSGILELLNKVGLTGSDMYKYPHQFSGGQRQRISIARSLTTEPEFLILDESVSSLDVSVQAQVLNLLNDLKVSLGLTYIFISHDLAVVKYMSDRIVVIREGEVEETGNPDQIFRFPTSGYTRTLIESIPGN